MKEKEKYQIKWFIAEFQELRKEINRRSKEQFICITASIVSLGSLIGILSQNPSKFYPLLIVICWVLAIFGFIWTDHSTQIFLIGSYIRDTVEDRINQFTNFDSEEKIGWEHKVRKIREKLKEQGGEPSSIITTLPLVFFILPSITIIFIYIIFRFFSEFELDFVLPFLVEILLIAIGFIFIYYLYLAWEKAKKIILDDS